MTTCSSYFYSRPAWLVVAVVWVGSLLGLLGQNLSAQVAPQQPTQSTTEADSGPKWVRASALIEQLEAVQDIPQAATWASETISILESLAKTQIGATNELGAYLVQLQNQRNLIPQVQASIWTESQYSPDAGYLASQNAIAVQRIGYRIDRRLEIWAPLSQLKTTTNFTDPWSTPASFRRISIGQLDPRWSEYLKLSDFRETFRSINPNPAQQKKVSRELLARLSSPVLTPAQKQYLDSSIDPSVFEFLRGHASNSIDIELLLRRIERYESQPVASAGHYLNDSFQDLVWSTDPAQNVIARNLQTHYRNANIRFSVSSRLLNRMIPQLPAMAEPVSETVQGAKISGNTQISNNLRIALEPNPTKLAIRLESMGHVDADTVARTNTFRVANQGSADFQVFQNLRIGPEGINALEAPYSVSSANQNVVGLQSKLDNVPLVGWMARKLATKKLREDAPQTTQLFKEKVRVSAENRMQQEVPKYVEKLRYYTYKNLMEPLIQMDLEPQAVQMSTSAEQLMMRYRIAGPDQMAANTARPRDSGHSLISFQLHQSAVNNAISRVGLSGNTFTIDELTKHLGEVIGMTGQTSHGFQDSPDGQVESESSDQVAEIGFSSLAPIGIEFVEDRFRITLNLKSLKVGEKGKKWKNLTLVAAYKPVASGMQFVLEQDDQETRIKGRKRIKFTDKAAISTVMKVLFKKQYVVNALPQQVRSRIGGENLMISQLVISDGWLGLSFDDRQLQPADVYFSEAPQRQPRSGGLRRFFLRR